jgi:xylulokinase
MEGPTRDDVLLGIDVGTSEVKVVAVNHAGNTLGSTSCPVSSSAWEPGFVEQQPEDWITATSQAVRKLVESQSVDLSKFVGVSVTGHMQVISCRNEFTSPCVLML